MAGAPLSSYLLEVGGRVRGQAVGATRSAWELFGGGGWVGLAAYVCQCGLPMRWASSSYEVGSI